MADAFTQPEPQSDTVKVGIPAVEHIKDTDWYMDDGDVVLLVKNRLFKVKKITTPQRRFLLTSFSGSQVFIRTGFDIFPNPLFTSPGKGLH